MTYVMSDCRGLGVTRDMSSRGVCIETDHVLKVGKRVRLLIERPVELDGGTPLRLVVVGKIVRSNRAAAAVSVLQHEYRLRPGLIEAQSQGFPGFSSLS